MKSTLVVLFFLCAWTGQSQSTPKDPMAAQIAGKGIELKKEWRLQPGSKAAEMQAGKFTLSGIAVQVAKAQNPLQLVNPAAPAQYGGPQQNVARAPDGRAAGLKFFSLGF